MNGRNDGKGIWPILACAAAVLLAGGVAQRWLEGELLAAERVPVRLEQPLASLPLDLDDWRGMDVPIQDRLVEVSGVDDYVNRQYVQARTGWTVNLYVGYAARPAKMLGHRPQVCYPAHGWTHMGSETVQLTLADGSIRQCLAHHFTRDWASPRQLLVLSYYVLQGRPTTDWTQFWGPRWRLPNLSRDPSVYVAQVQVSIAVVEDSRVSTSDPLKAGIDFVTQMAPRVEALLPLVPEATLQ